MTYIPFQLSRLWARPFDIVALDLVIQDRNVDLTGQNLNGAATLREMSSSFVVGSKNPVSNWQEFHEHADTLEPVESIGGSAFNMLNGLQALTEIDPHNKLRLGFYTHLGDIPAAKKISASFKHSKITLFKLRVPPAIRHVSGILTNLVINDGDDRRVIAQHDVAAKPVFEADNVITPKLFANARMVVQQLSIGQKLGFPVLKKILESIPSHIDICCGLPTNTSFFRKLDTKQQQYLNDFIQNRVNILSSNDVELHGFFGEDADDSKVISESTIRKDLQKLHSLWQSAGPKTDGKKRMALITTGESGGYLLTESGGIEKIAAVSVDGGKTLGAGDATLAGFLYALNKGHPPRVAADIAMHVGAAKVHQNSDGAALVNPKASLMEIGGDTVWPLLNSKQTRQNLRARTGVAFKRLLAPV